MVHRCILFLCRDAKPVFSFVYLNILKTRLFQIRFQLGVLVDGHTVDNFRPLFVLVRVTAALIADEKCPTGLQHPPDFPKALRQIRPEVDRFKRGNRIKPILCKDDMFHAALPHRAAPFLNGSPV